MSWAVFPLSLSLIAASAQVSSPSDPAAIISQARQLLASGHNTQAAEFLAAYLQLEPADSEARLQFAQVLSWEERYAESIAQYRLLLEDEPGNQQIRFGLAQALAWSGRTDEALGELALLLQEAPANGEYRLLKAQAQSWGGQLDFAASSYLRLLADEPDSALAWAGLADTYRWAGQSKEAERAYRKALSLGPGSEAAEGLQALLAEKELLSVVPSGGRFRDADDVSIWRSGFEAKKRLNWDWSSSLAYDTALVSQKREGLTRHRILLGAQRAVTKRIEVEAKYLLSAFTTGKETHGVILNLHLALPGGGSTQLELSRRDILDEVLTFGSVAGTPLHGYLAKGNLWQELPWGFDIGAGGVLGRYSDNNRTASGSFSLGYTISGLAGILGRLPPVRLGYGLFVLTYSKRSSRYWDPSHYLSQGLRVSSSCKILRYLDLSAEGGLSQGNEAGNRTLEFGGGGRVEMKLPAGLSGGFEYNYSESARMTSGGGGNYWSQRWAIYLSRSF